MTDTHDDADVLFPEHELTIRGEAITVREFTFIEGVRVRRRLEPLLDVFEAGAESDETSLDVLGELFDEHEDLMVDLVAQACDRDADWVRTLSDADGQALNWAFWAVNKGFFLRRVAMRSAARQARADREAEALDGAKSSAASSPTGTTGTDSDDATPSDS